MRDDDIEPLRDADPPGDAQPPRDADPPGDAEPPRDADPPFDPENPPIAGWFGDDPVVDVSRIPADQLVSVLSRYHPRTYGPAVARYEGSRPVNEVMAAAGMAELEWLERRERRRRISAETLAHARPLPGAGAAVGAAVRAPERRRPRQRQVNFRLFGERHADLERAAALVSMRPTALARLLVVRGVDRILREADADA